ncbi:alpha/beta fold hydrolase [Wenjunlia tyrosinilytica]|uniref:Hydrolase n=1 Tax=Wenjunlia tyrosinilytica TaxID=1544741 RepID=A0A917ZQ17_9ACTN|nr:alpha/beta hydrolase [Wenjunlia tyrosinilytica]GGO89261.1 hydrolase [Wenjunlia tyrosinilytica]
MPTFTSYDGTELAYQVLEPGGGEATAPLVCLPGGPGRDASYLEDLGGLNARRPLVVLENRGTGGSAAAADPSSYAFPRLAEDVEALRRHLGLERFALLAHSAAATTALAYAARHGERLSRMVLIAPGSRILGERMTDMEEIFRSRAGEPWFEDVQQALAELETATELPRVKELMLRVGPLSYGTWGERQRAHAGAEPDQLHPVPRAGFWQGVDESARKAIVSRLAETACPVLVVTGEADAATGVRAGELIAERFPNGRSTTLPGAGHYPWVDSPEEFRDTVESFLEGS